MIANPADHRRYRPSGGAGIPADLKTFSPLGGYGMNVVTGLVARNTRGVRSVHGVPASFVIEQRDGVFDEWAR
jgi:hydroxymethylpyrimidine/phosphomethylpyrimidine kinase